MDVSRYKRKFKQLFDKILKGDFEISAYHSENILKYLDGSRDRCTGKILETPFFADLIIYALKNYDHASTSVKIFVVKIVTIVLRNEVQFNRFLHMHGFDSLVMKGKEEFYGMPTALHLAFIEQAMTLATHYSGVKYITEQKLYRQMLRPYTHHRPPTLAKCMYEVMSKLVWKLNEYDEEAELLEAIQFIVQPIITIDYQSAVNLSAECEKTASDQLVSFLQTLVTILGEIDRLVVPNNVVPILMRLLPIESKLTLILEETRDAELACLLAEVCLRYYYAASRQAALHDRAEEDHISEKLNVAFDKILHTLVKKRSVTTVLDFSCRCHIFWHKVEAVGPAASFERFGRRFQLQSQFLIMVLVPIFVKQKANQRLVDDLVLQDAFETFIYDLVEIIPHEIITSAYRLRELINETGMVEACLWSVREIFKLKGYLNQRQAGIVYQTLYYALSEYVLSDGTGDLVLVQNPLRTPDDELLVSSVLEAIKMLLEEHEITWYDSLEIINLQAALMNLIKQNILSNKLLIQAVDLINVSVQKLLSPELALLLESERGGSLREVGGAIRTLLVHEDWLVRVSGLRLLSSFSEVAYVKFVPLRKVISEHALVVSAARAALGDPEPRAQACALRCLAAAAKCECVWKELLTHYHHLYEQLVYILRYHVEGEVRKEAAKVLTQVYINHKVTRTFTTYVSRVMAHAAVDDRHWEVQTAALDYWGQFMKNEFTDRGMIDGSFPTVTFSKEKRKIVTLNEKEVLRQIEGAMDYLSSSGCLTVLLRCLTPYNRIEVIEKTFAITSRLVGVLDKYSPKDSTSQPCSSAKLNGDVEMQSVPVITQTTAIDKTKLDQGDLISEIFECFSDSSGGDPVPIEIVHPYKFLEMVKSTDYEAIIKNKKKASDTADLDTLIDELILPGKTNKISQTFV